MISSKLDEENGEESEEITGTGDENINIEETIENEEAAYGGEIANTENENQKIENIIE